MGNSIDVCHCLATVGAEEKEDLKSMEKFKLYTIDCLDDSALPQLITARVCPADEVLICPATGKNCMHYHIMAEELIEVGKDDDDEPIKKWVHRFEMSKSVDFYLADPQSPETLVFVPGKSIEIRRHLEDTSDDTSEKNLDDPTRLSFGPNENIPKGIQAVATAKKFNLYQPSGMFNFARKVKKDIRYSVFSFDMNEQIAILAVINEGLGPEGAKLKVISPLSDNSLSAEYFKQYSWSDRDKLSWAALTGSGPCVLATKDPKFFQGFFIDNTNYEIPNSGSSRQNVPTHYVPTN